MRPLFLTPTPDDSAQITHWNCNGEVDRLENLGDKDVPDWNAKRKVERAGHLQRTTQLALVGSNEREKTYQLKFSCKGFLAKCQLEERTSRESKGKNQQEQSCEETDIRADGADQVDECEDC